MPNIQLPEKMVLYTDWMKTKINEAVEQAKYEADKHPNDGLLQCKDEDLLQCRFETLQKMQNSFNESGRYIKYYDFKEFLRILMEPYISEF